MQPACFMLLDDETQPLRLGSAVTRKSRIAWYFASGAFTGFLGAALRFLAMTALCYSRPITIRTIRISSTTPTPPDGP